MCERYFLQTRPSLLDFAFQNTALQLLNTSIFFLTEFMNITQKRRQIFCCFTLKRFHAYRNVTEGSSHVERVISQLLHEAVTEPYCICCCNRMGGKKGDVLKITEKIKNGKGYLGFQRLFTETTKCFQEQFVKNEGISVTGCGRVVIPSEGKTCFILNAILVWGWGKNPKQPKPKNQGLLKAWWNGQPYKLLLNAK